MQELEHALVAAASDTVNVAKFVETSVLPALKTAGQFLDHRGGDETYHPPGSQHRASRFAVRGVVINAIDAAGDAAGANGLNMTMDAQLVADVKAIASAVKSAVGVTAVPAAPAK